MNDPERRSGSTLTAYCLCAEWCGVCRTLRPSMETLQIEGVEVVWVDIEVETGWADEFELTSFPTLVIKAEGRTLFAGPVEPRPTHILRLLESLRDSACP